MQYRCSNCLCTRSALWPQKGNMAVTKRVIQIKLNNNNEFKVKYMLEIIEVFLTQRFDLI